MVENVKSKPFPSRLPSTEPSAEELREELINFGGVRDHVPVIMALSVLLEKTDSFLFSVLSEENLLDRKLNDTQRDEALLTP